MIFQPSRRVRGTVSFRSSMLPAYEGCCRRFGAAYLFETGLDKELGIKLNRPKAHVGSAVGTSCHSGHAYLMEAFATTGEHGGDERAGYAMDVARTQFGEIAKDDGIGYDKTTATQQGAEAAITRMIRRLHQDYQPDSMPILVEAKLKATVLPGLELTGHVDLYLIEKALNDLKTGVWRPQPFSQFGSYGLIMEANQIPVETMTTLYLPRVSTKREQPPCELIPIRPAIAKRQALSVARHAHRDVTAMLDSGDVEHLVANPSDNLCDPRFCPAFGTKFCAIGAEHNRHKIGREL